MPNRRNALTPEALAMMDAIARTGSFAAAARELGRVPSALTYSVRQLEEALDVLLFDRRSRQAQLTAAGEELLAEGRRLLAEIDAVTNRVRRVASGWESQLTIAYDGVISRVTLFELAESFFALRPEHDGKTGRSSDAGPATRLRLRTEVLAGTWEALLSGQADLAIGAGTHTEPPAGVQTEPLGEVAFVLAVAPHHPLARSTSPITDAVLAPPRRRRGRFGAAPVADHREPAARSGRHDGCKSHREAGGSVARPRLRFSSRTAGASPSRRRPPGGAAAAARDQASTLLLRLARIVAPRQLRTCTALVARSAQERDDTRRAAAAPCVAVGHCGRLTSSHECRAFGRTRQPDPTRKDFPCQTCPNCSITTARSANTGPIQSMRA